jgi:imidazole glycerol-phosphate synthase subunit HisH
MTITAIIDYGSGNLRSAAKAFQRCVAELGLHGEILVTGDADAVRRADRIVLPGVGAYADCKAGLLAVDGMMDVLTERVRGAGVPFLGICVGMQLMADAGLEHGRTEGFGWVPGVVERIEPTPEADGRARKIPHMGWNRLEIATVTHPVLEGLGGGDYAYFVHSYAMTVAHAPDRLAGVDYGGPVTAIIGRENMVGTQFHPEKSQKTGLRLISNFLEWTP